MNQPFKNLLGDFQPRTYRTQFNVDRFKGFVVTYLETDLWIGVDMASFDEKMKFISEKYGISKRETEVIELICKGMTNQEISDSLFISVQTVKDHIHRIFLKTGVKNRVQLTNILEK